MLGKGKKKGKDEHAAEANAAAPAAEGEGDAEGGKKKLPMKLIIIAVVAVVFLAGGGAAGYLLFVKPKHAEPAKVAEAKAKPKKKEKGKEGGKPEEGMGKTSEGPNGVTYYAFPTILSDMQGSDGRPGQVKLEMTFELANEEIADNINENMPRVKDMLQTFLRELRPEDINGSEGDFRLRQELMRRVNLIIAPAQINTINLTGLTTS